MPPGRLHIQKTCLLTPKKVYCTPAKIKWLCIQNIKDRQKKKEERKKEKTLCVCDCVCTVLKYYIKSSIIKKCRTGYITTGTVHGTENLHCAFISHKHTHRTFTNIYPHSRLHHMHTPASPLLATLWSNSS